MGCPRKERRPGKAAEAARVKEDGASESGHQGGWLIMKYFWLFLSCECPSKQQGFYS